MSKSIQTPDRFFKTPFSPAYWRCAAGELSNIRILAVAALFMALDFVISSMFIPVGENLRIYFSFFVKALGCMIYGPVVGLVTGFAGDILGYFVHPNGAFFPGYTLTSMLSALTYALFFYRTKITVLKIFCCKLFINVFINIGLGSLWSAMQFGKGFYYYLAKSTVKNFLLLPLEVALLVLFFRMMLPVVERMKLAPPRAEHRIPVI